MTRGIEVVQANTNIVGAADYQKTLDSRWEFLEISQEMVCNFSGSEAFGSKLLDHNLGFLPGFTVTGAFNSNNITLFADTNSVYISSTSAGQYFVRIYNLDISSEYKAPNRQIINTIPADKADTIGIKVLKDGAGNINSEDVGDFSFLTNARNIGIQMHGTRATNASGHLVFVHDAGYPPTYFVARIQTNIGATAFPPRIFPMNQAFGFATANASTIDIRGAQTVLSGNYAVLVLKDPVEVAS